MPTSKPDFETKLARYVHLIVHTGCNLQPGQELFVASDIANAQLVRRIVAEAYAAGASEVTVRWTDEQVTRMHYDNRPLEAWRSFPAWQAELQNGVASRGAALLFIDSEDPQLMAGVDPRKLAARSKAATEACPQWRRGMDFGLNVWCIVGAATPAWAARVFPDLPIDEAVSRLWDEIFATVRCDAPDPDATWQARETDFKARMATLNGLGLDRLHYTNSLGTDLTVGLVEGGIWNGGGETTKDGTFFFPNMPTEEVYTSPDRNRTQGIVYSALPLNHGGSLVERFWVRFEDGRAVDCGAERGIDVLRSIIDTDDGSHYLGECALVPKESPIHQSKVLFLSTLFDENAACHLALGASFAECCPGGLDLTREELLARGLNQSATHVDFMVGTDDLDITGYTRDGREVPVFRNGTWAL